MSTETGLSPELVADLLEALARAGDASQACAIVLRHATAGGGPGRALVMVREGDELRGAAAGLTAEQLADALSAAAGADSELARTLAPDAAQAAAPRGAVPPLDFDGYVLIPFDAGNPARRGALILEAAAPNAATERAAELCRRAGAALGHGLAVEVERARAEHLSRQCELLRGNLDELQARVRDATLALEEQSRRLAWQGQEIEKAYRLKSEFLANMSHELRTPINVVLGYTSLLREQIYGMLNTRQAEALEKVYGTSQHLLELINDILDLSKIEAGKMPLHLEELSVADVLAELSETFEPLVRKKALTYRTQVAEDLPRLRTDRTKLKQVLLNLLSNAIKFTHEGSVTVEAARIDDAAVRIVVEDTGIGIKPEHLDTIFEDFRQADQSHTREYGGTGLGLSITRKLLSLLGGTIGVSSRYGAGSAFTIELPLLLDSETIETAPGRLRAEGAVVPR